MNMKTIVTQKTKDRNHPDLSTAIKAGKYDEVNGLYSILSSKQLNKRLTIESNQPGREIVFLGDWLSSVYRQNIEMERKRMGLLAPTLEDCLLIGEQIPEIHEELLDGRGVVFFLPLEKAIFWSGYTFYPVLDFIEGRRILTLKQFNDPHDGFRYTWAYQKKVIK